jgi:hypothetical protein
MHYAENPLTTRLPWKMEFYKRVKLFPWWLKYNIGINRQATLKDKITDLARISRLDERYTKKLLRHAVSEFSKNGLGADYYGYHNIDHELEVTYFSLLAADYHLKKGEFSINDVKAIFVAALFHDFDPLKRFDKPHEDDVESFVRGDDKIGNLVQKFNVDINIMLALIHRTTYPFKGDMAKYAEKRIDSLLTEANVPESDVESRNHFRNLGWFLSICDRIASYCMNDFEYSMNLARLNAHAMGWHPSVINEQSVKYFTSLKEEKNMLDFVLRGIPENYTLNLYNNISEFRHAWENEVNVKNSIRRNDVNLVSIPEKCGKDMDLTLKNSIIKLYKEFYDPVILEKAFKRTLDDSEAILISLRTNSGKGDVVGYVKGGSLEKYRLRRGTVDANYGKKNTAYMEWIKIKPAYWGETGGHLLRSKFLHESRQQGYQFVSSYVHRDVILSRQSKGETIEIVQKYDPDKLDYYRIKLTC